MKKIIKINSPVIHSGFIFVALLLIFTSATLQAQDTTSTSLQTQDATQSTKAEPVKYTFEGTWIIDNQTVMVPNRGAFEFGIQHRFGTVNNGWEDVFGVLAPTNIRLALSYVPIKRLIVGVGLTKEMVEVDINAKYAILLQTPGSMPVSLTYFGNVAMDTRDQDFRYEIHRFSYFNQLLIARKMSNKISLQVAPSISWFNNVEGYVDNEGEIQKKMENTHLAIAFSGVYKFNKSMGLLLNYDQPISEHTTNNPDPNLSLGVEFSTGSHVFQVFFGNYYYILPQNNNFYNQNDYTNSRYLIGFNITRIWD